LEYLETKGVPVVGFRTGVFPNFFTPSSGLKLSNFVDKDRTQFGSSPEMQGEAGDKEA